ncbi:MAG: energy transducer TonB [Alphaproteobacteria bacterium]|nr:energy transducer TonB [Alphaproteobacteria bacterium]
MLIRTTQTLSTWAMRALFYAALFGVVVLAHMAISGILRAQGWGGGTSLFAAGAAVLVLVIVVTNAAEWLRDRLRERREMQRVQQRLPSGPCCVVWRTQEDEKSVRQLIEQEDGEHIDMPWDVAGPLRARYPKLARRLGIEGVAIAEFEVGADGRAKNINCIDAWPSDVFYEAAREALLHAKFQPKDVHVRFGASYKMPFVFRISGASKAKDVGRRARTLRPTLVAAEQAVENLRRQTGAPR